MPRDVCSVLYAYYMDSIDGDEAGDEAGDASQEICVPYCISLCPVVPLLCPCCIPIISLPASTEVWGVNRNARRHE